MDENGNEELNDFVKDLSIMRILLFEARFVELQVS